MQQAQPIIVDQTSENAVAIAGWLAEHGVNELRLTDAARQTLLARQTDLPASLMKLKQGAVLSVFGRSLCTLGVDHGRFVIDAPGATPAQRAELHKRLKEYG